MPTAATEPSREARPARAASTARPDEYLSFRLGAGEYGIDLLKVQEIRGYEKPIRIANAPPAIRGVINLRGAIVPIVDLRLLLGLPDARDDGFTVVIVLNIGGRVTGVVVDSASDVIAPSPDAIRDAPEMSSAADAGRVLGLASIGDRTLILLDIERLIASTRMAHLG